MKKSFWQSGVFRFWLVCYLLVLGIPMIFSAVAQHRIFEDLKKRTYDQSVSAVEQLASTVDEQWKALFRISDAICSSSRMCKLRGVSLPYNAERFYEVHSRASALADYSVNSLTISGLYIYSANLDSLLDAGHIYQQGMQLNTASRKYLGLEPEDLFELTSTRRLHDLIVTADGKLLLLQTFSTGFSEPVTSKIISGSHMEIFLKWSTRVMGVAYNYAYPECTVLEAISRLESFFRSMGLPTRMSELKDASGNPIGEVTESTMLKMAKRVRVMFEDGTVGGYKHLNTDDIVNIFKLSL